MLFFLAGIGDKIQFSTVLSGAQYDRVLSVTAGTTCGILSGTVHVIFSGHRHMERAL